MTFNLSSLINRPADWIDLRPYLYPGFVFEPSRGGKNAIPRCRLVNGVVELSGVVNYNVTNAPPAIGKVLRLPEGYRPQYTAGLVGFCDVASPLWFGTASYIVFGSTIYGNMTALHGDLMLSGSSGIPGSVTTQSLSLDNIRIALN